MTRVTRRGAPPRVQVSFVWLFLYGVRKGGTRMVRINGEDVSADGKILKDYLLENGYTLTTIAVERNGEILPKAQYGTAVLKPDDVIEIVSFVGGG